MVSTGSQKQEPSLSDIFGQLTELNKPSAVSDVSKMNFGAMDPSVMQGIVADGGPLSSAESFANSNAWAMTPETFKSTMQNRPDAMKVAGDATTLSDAVFGNRERSKALLEAQGRDASTRNANASSAMRRLGEIEGDRTRRDISANELSYREREGAANRSFDRDKLAFEKTKHADDLNYKYRALKLAESSRGSSSQVQAVYQGLMNGSLHDKKDEMKIIEQLNSPALKQDKAGYSAVQRKALSIGALPDKHELVIQEPTGSKSYWRGTPEYAAQRYRTNTRSDGKSNVRVVEKFVPARSLNPITNQKMPEDGWVAVQRTSQGIYPNMFGAGASGGSSRQTQLYPDGSPD